MTSVAGPALAFYFEHGLEFDALIAMQNSLKEKRPDEWKMLSAVFDHASNQVAGWLQVARDRAVGTIRSDLATVPSPKKKKKEPPRWFMWAKLTPSGRFTLETKDLWLGVTVDTAPDGTVYFSPYFATSDPTSRDQLAERLRTAGFSDAKHPGDWLGTDAVALKMFPLDKSTDLDAVTAQSTELFEQVVKKWDVVFRR